MILKSGLLWPDEPRHYAVAVVAVVVVFFFFSVWRGLEVVDSQCSLRGCGFHDLSHKEFSPSFPVSSVGFRVFRTSSREALGLYVGLLLIGISTHMSVV